MVEEISCKRAGIDCEFLIRSENPPELLGFVQDTAANGVDVSEDDLRDQLIDV